MDNLDSLIVSFIGTSIGFMIVYVIFGIDFNLISFLICWILSTIFNAWQEKRNN